MSPYCGVYFELSLLFHSASFPDANWNRAVCQPEKILLGGHLRSWGDRQLQLVEGFHSAQSCQAACCQSSSCDAFWLLEKMCIQVNCMIPHQCQASRTDSSDSILVFLKKSKTTEHSLSSQHEGEVETLLHKLLDWCTPVQAKKRPRRSFRELLTQKQNLANDKRGLLKRDTTDLSTRGNAENLPASTLDSASKNDLRISTSELPVLATFSSPIAQGLTATAKAEKLKQSNNTSVQPLSLEEILPTISALQGKNTMKMQTVIAMPTGVPTNDSGTTVQTIPATSSSTPTPVPVTKELVVSAGNNVQVTLPKNEVQLNAFVLPEPPTGTSYTYDWRLITHPKDSSGEMEGKHSQILKLSKLTVGLYEFKVIVDGGKAHGEGYVNVTVNPKPRVNQPPVAIVSPQSQEISLPTTSTVIDGSQSTDDYKIVSFHWEELKGPLREEKVSTDTGVRTPILQLSAMQEGDYTYQLTVTDSAGQQSTAEVTVIVQPGKFPLLLSSAVANSHLYRHTSDLTVLHFLLCKMGIILSVQLACLSSMFNSISSFVVHNPFPENNKPPKADAGPDKELTLPVDSTTLDGSKSSDDQKIVSFLWEKTRGLDGVKLENANSSIATVTGLEVGTYEFTLTVKDERSLQSQSSVNVIVKEEMNKPPVAKIAGNVVVTLPTNTAALDGSKSWDDKGIVSYLWTRDEGSPAAGEVLNNSDHHPVLFLSNLVEGTYTFHLKVTDAKGESDTDRTTVEVKADPRKNNLVEMILDVNVSQLTERQKGMLIRQIGVLLGVLDSDITVQKIQPYTEQSTKMVFFVQNQPPHQIFKGHDVAWTLKSELRKQQSDFLIFRALEINTVTCQLNCSEHGHCDSFTKRCICDPFWMENFIKVQMGEGESNCEWSVLYVIIASFVIVVAFGILSWTVVCCCKRRKGKPKRKSKYKILDATDQESLELKPNLKAGSRQKAQVLNTSLMHSESELDSDEAIFTWPDREKGRLLRSQNGSLRNGQVLPKPKNQREEIL
uniref:KIAA0319 like n=1 Tax=Chelonoidis abingdonii TaxID=106734 RepID=A0A8C0GN72_CHEAB